MENKSMKLKTHLLIIMILVIVVPVVVLYLNMINLTNVISSMEETKKMRYEGIRLAEQAEKVIEENYHMLNNFDLLTKELQPFLNNEKGRIVISNMEDIVLYDSEVKGIKGLGVKADKYFQQNSLNFNINFMRFGTSIIGNFNFAEVMDSKGEFVFYFPYKFQVMQNGEHIANGTLYVDYGPEATAIVQRVYLKSKTIFLGPFLSLVFMIWLLSRIIDKKVLKPLEELNIAASKMTKEDFSYPITYKSENEMGEFCDQFINMRNHLVESRQKLIEDSIARKVLIGNIAHDLRTPITSIKGYVEGLLDKVAVKPEDREKYYEVIKDKADQLDFLINDLFTFSQLELGQLKINRESVSIMELFGSLVKSNQNISIKLDNRILNYETLLDIDKKHIKRVFRNIIDNSMKFGASEIIISSYKIDNYLKVEIKDNGIGITQDILDKVFDRFFTYVPKEASKAGGSGMGLAICKEIINLHGGEIGVESIMGKGTVISFTLPLANKM